MSNFSTDFGDWSTDGAPVVAGPKVGFSEAFSKAYESQVRAEGSRSLGWEMYRQEEKLLDEVYQLTGERMDSVLSGGFNTAPKDFFLHYDKGEPLPEPLAERVARLEELRQQHPELRNYDALVAGTKEAAQTAEAEFGALQDRPQTWGGFFGGIAGGMIGSFNPNSDPFNVMTLGVGGVGRTAIQRIAAEGALGGAVEAINEFTGVRENRSLLGLENGLDRSLRNIGLAALGSGAFQAAGEGAAVAVRRLLPRVEPRSEIKARELIEESRAFVRENTPVDTAEARRLFMEQLESRYKASNAWGETDSVFAADRNRLLTSTAAPTPAETGIVNRYAREPVATRFRDVTEVQAEIRAQDPKTFRTLESVAQALEKSRTRVAELEAELPAADAFAAVQRQADEISAEIADLRSKISETTDGRKKKRFSRKIEEAREHLSEVEKSLKGSPRSRAAIESDLAKEARLQTKYAERQRTLQRRADQIDRKVTKSLGKVENDPEAVEFLRALRGASVNVFSPPRVDVDRILRETAEALEAREKDVTPAFQAQRIELDPDTGAPVPVVRADGAEPEIPDPDFVEFAGRRVPRNTRIQFEDGTMTIDELLDDFAEDDALLDAAMRCKVTL